MKKRLECDRLDDPADRRLSPSDTRALLLPESVRLSMAPAPSIAPFEMEASGSAPEISAFAPVCAMRPGAWAPGRYGVSRVYRSASIKPPLPGRA